MTKPGNGSFGVQARTERGRITTIPTPPRSEGKKPRNPPIPAAPRKIQLPRNKSPNTKRCIFVVDPSVFVHDPTSLYQFGDNDVYVTIWTLRCLEDHQKGDTEISMNARRVSEDIDALFDAKGKDAHRNGVPIPLPKGVAGDAKKRGKLIIETVSAQGQKPVHGLDTKFSDDKIIEACLALKASLEEKRDRREVILVSKKPIMRLRASTFGITAEDFLGDVTIEDANILRTGVHTFEKGFWEEQGKNGLSSTKLGSVSTYQFQESALGVNVHTNEFLSVRDGDQPLGLIVRGKDDGVVHANVVTDYAKHKVFGITARNEEQNFALNLLMDPDISFVTILGGAGTGKTLLALASGLEQVIERRVYTGIVVTRITVPVGGEDIGFLPGDEKEKIVPWMGAFMDNLEVLTEGYASGDEKMDPRKSGGQDRSQDWGRPATRDLILSRVEFKAVTLVRGRSFFKKYLVVDEAQNMTRNVLKTVITRAGPGTKIVCLGNLGQIDTSYLDDRSSGLTAVVQKFENLRIGGHIILLKNERSQLADFAEKYL